MAFVLLAPPAAAEDGSEKLPRPPTLSTRIVNTAPIPVSVRHSVPVAVEVTAPIQSEAIIRNVPGDPVPTTDDAAFRRRFFMEFVQNRDGDLAMSGKTVSLGTAQRAVVESISFLATSPHAQGQAIFLRVRKDTETKGSVVIPAGAVMAGADGTRSAGHELTRLILESGDLVTPNVVPGGGEVIIWLNGYIID